MRNYPLLLARSLFIQYMEVFMKCKLWTFYRSILAGIVVLSLAACGGGGGSSSDSSSGNNQPPPVTSPKWTYMVYIAADNNLAPAALYDLQEMEAVGSTAGVNVVVQVKFSPDQLRNSGMGDLATAVGNTTYRGKIIKNTTNDLLASDFQPLAGQTNMASKEALTSFIQWAKQTYPAENYALVLWSHGAGWKKLPLSKGLATRGALADDSSNSFMTMQDITAAINSSGVHFGLVNFDACLMAMYEVAYSLRNVADFLVASEEVEPGLGDNYTLVLSALTANPTQTPSQLAQVIPAKFRETYVAMGAENRDSITKSAIDLSKIGTVKTSLDDLATYMTDNLATSGSLRPTIQSARDAGSTLSFNTSNRDLGLFLDNLKTASTDSNLTGKVTTARAAIAAAIVKNDRYSPAGATSDLSTVTGMSVFLPKDGAYLDTDLTEYDALGNTLDAGGWKWGGFLRQLLTGGAAPRSTTRGDFGFAISWDNPNVDLDLYVYEPIDLASPWLGTTSNNGYLTADSATSNASYEAYAAMSIVEAGHYDIFIQNYTGGNSTVNVTLWYTDPVFGDWRPLWEKPLNTTAGCNAESNAFMPDANYSDLIINSYCDWIYDPGIQAEYDTWTILTSRSRSLFKNSKLNTQLTLSPDSSKHKLAKRKLVKNGASQGKSGYNALTGRGSR
jgi:hypothetical protein